MKRLAIALALTMVCGVAVAQTNTATFTPTASNTWTFTPTLTPTKTPTATNTGTETFTPTDTPTATSTATNSWTVTATWSYTATNTYTPSHTPSYTPTATPTMTYYPLSFSYKISSGTCSLNRVHALYITAGETAAASATLYNGKDFAAEPILDIRAATGESQAFYMYSSNTAFYPAYQSDPWPSYWEPDDNEIKLNLTGTGASISILKQ